MLQISFLYNLNFIARRHLGSFFCSVLHFTHEDAEAQKQEDIYPRLLGKSVARTRLNSGLLCILAQNDFLVEGQESFAHFYL